MLRPSKLKYLVSGSPPAPPIAGHMLEHMHKRNYVAVCGYARLRHCKLNYVTVTFWECCLWLRKTTSQTELHNCCLLEVLSMVSQDYIANWTMSTCTMSTCTCTNGSIVHGFTRLHFQLNYVSTAFWPNNKKAMCLVWCSLFPWTRNQLHVLSFYVLMGGEEGEVYHQPVESGTLEMIN